MKDYGGFGEEPYYDLDGDGDLNLFEQASMHTEQDFEMMEMFDDPLVSNHSKKSSPHTGPQKMGCGTRIFLFILAVIFLRFVEWSDSTFVGCLGLLVSFILIIVLATN